MYKISDHDIHYVDSLDEKVPSTYQKELIEFEAISQARAIVVKNLHNKPLPLHTLNKILYALLKSKPIIIQHTYKTSPHHSLTLQKVLENRLSKLLLINLDLLDLNDKKQLLANIDNTVNYTLTKNNKIAIRSTLRKYFRELL